MSGSPVALNAAVSVNGALNASVSLSGAPVAVNASVSVNDVALNASVLLTVFLNVLVPLTVSVAVTSCAE